MRRGTTSNASNAMTQRPMTKKQRTLGAAEALLTAIESPDGGSACVTVRVGAADRTGSYTVSEFIDAMTLLLREGVTPVASRPGAPGPPACEVDDLRGHPRMTGGSETFGESRRLQLETVRARIQRRAAILRGSLQRHEEVNPPNGQGVPSEPSTSHRSAFSH